MSPKFHFHLLENSVEPLEKVVTFPTNLAQALFVYSPHPSASSFPLNLYYYYFRLSNRQKAYF